jgi:hypothetical protein
MHYMQATKAITVRVAITELVEIMQKRAFKTQSDAIHALIAEEAERLRALSVLQTTAGTATMDDFDDRFL